jgi:hypothetical protein
LLPCGDANAALSQFDDASAHRADAVLHECERSRRRSMQKLWLRSGFTRGGAQARRSAPRRVGADQQMTTQPLNLQHR